MLRITGGNLRGHLIQTASQGVRPTQAKLRQALFNSLQGEWAGAHVLDLFAGSGALGFEALSRGAEKVVFVERDRKALHYLKKNAMQLKVEDRAIILAGAVHSLLPKIVESSPYQVVLADPPYGKGWETRLLMTLPWPELLALQGFFCVEWGVQKSTVSELPNRVPFLVKVREKSYGDSVLSTYLRDEKA